MKRAALLVVAVLIGATAATSSVASSPKAQNAASAKTKDPCAKLKKVDRADGLLCTHGGDSADKVKKSPPDGAPASPAAALCPDGGVSGKRIEVIYAIPQDRTNNYAASVTSVRNAVSEADAFLAASQSAIGSQHYRWLCVNGTDVTVRNVTLIPVGNDSSFTFDDMVYSLQNQVAEGLGPVDYEAADRIYLTFVGQISGVYPFGGQGSIWNDDRSDPAVNLNNNSGPHYSLIAGFSGAVAEHEIGHNIGAVQLSAPHSSGGWHCYDENDEMCYNDGGSYFANGGSLVTNCPSDPATQFDCLHDDYYNLQPPSGSYLDTHWNVTDSGWLTPVSAPPPCPDASFEPDNTAAQARTFTIGSTETHAFCTAGDQDWVKFQGTAGTTYRIETLNLMSSNDTYLELYQSNGATLIAADDDSGDGLASLISFTPTASSTYYVKARHFSSTAAGVGLTYDLRITSNAPQNLLRNSGFELDANADGRPDNWTSNPKFTRSSAVVFSGSFSGRHRATDNTNHTISQTVANLSAGTTYNFSGRTNIPATSDTFTFKLQVTWRNSSNAAISTRTIKTYSAATTGWNLSSVSVLAPTGTAKAVVKMVATNLKATIYVDDFVFRR